MTTPILNNVLIILIFAVLVIVFFRALKFPVILGYLVVGGLIGPHGLGLVPDAERSKELAEFGVVFLMFTVGLEFSLSRLISLRHAVLFLGGLQVILTILISSAIGIAVGIDTNTSLVIGCVIATSSTAVVIKQLKDQHEIIGTHGSNAVGILLFQDLAVIPMLILIGSIGHFQHEAAPIRFGLAIANGILAVAIILAIGRWLIKPLFHMIQSSKSVELFTLAVLLVALSSAWLSHHLGLSFALGAFLAGMMLGETEFQHQIEREIRPFRDVLLGLFFITIGMMINLPLWRDAWIWITLTLLALMVGKTLLIILLSKLSGHTYMTAFRTGIVLAQGGEFGFAILTLALNKQLIPLAYAQVVLGAIILSLAVAPILIHFNKRIAGKLLGMPV